MNLTKTSWPLGWLPDADGVNGDPNGLVRMDNLRLDETGVLSLVKGIKQIGTAFSDYVDRIFARGINGTETYWLGLGGSGRSIVRGSSSFTEVATGTNRACFGDALGNVLILAGQKRVKDKGTGTPINLGLATPNPPTISSVNQSTKDVNGIYVVIEGTPNGGGTNSMDFSVDATTLQGIVKCTFPKTSFLDLGDGPAQNINDDIIQFAVIPNQSTNVTSMKLEFLLGDPVDPPVDYYWINITPDALLQGQDQRSVIQFKRSDFDRSGTGPFGWGEVFGLRFTIDCTVFMNINFGAVTFIGGAQGQMNGTYNYIAVDVNNNGIYQAKSPCSKKSDPVTVVNGRIQVASGGGDSFQATETWYFRFGGTLEQYYRVGISDVGGVLNDTLSDQDAILLDITLNPNLKSLQPLTDGNGLIDDIFCVEGLHYERMLYMTIREVILSDRLDPDSYDARYTIRASGDPTEINLWLKKLTNNVVMLGTNKNLYELTGTFLDLPDGSIDVAINPIGEQFPPLTQDLCAADGAIYYVGSDGIRVTTGSNSISFSNKIRLLFEGETRNGVAPVVTTNSSHFALAAGRGRIYVALPTGDGNIYLVVFDTINQYWRLQYTDPISLLITPTGKLLAGYNLASSSTITSGGLFQLDDGDGIENSDGSQNEGLPFTFQTVFDSNQQPRNRKDTFTLKVIAETGGRDCTVYIAKDEGSYNSLGPINSSTLTTFYFPLNQYTLGFRYSIKIVDHNLVTFFKLYEVTIEYDPRPEQLDFLRIPPNNLGSFARKRVTNFAMVIDTLGNHIEFDPIVDGVQYGSGASNIVGTGNPIQFSYVKGEQLQTLGKTTYIYYFKGEVIGTDFSGILSGGVFEFYGLLLEEITSEKLPTPREYLVIPNNDYGSPNRKRHSSYKFQINTRGSNVIFTPKLDGVLFNPLTINTREKRIVEYFFTFDTIAKEVGGILDSNGSGIPFEFYEVIIPQHVETLPDRLTFYKIPNTNFDVAAPKRLRTLPIVIDTQGRDVFFSPYVDGVPYPPTKLNSVDKTTLFYFFDRDAFGIDIGGTLISDSNFGFPFEFYNLGQPEIVEVLPVAKRFDQLGPVRVDKIGKYFHFRIRLIQLGFVTTTIPINFFGSNSQTTPVQQGTPLYSKILDVVPNEDQVYQFHFPKSINNNLVRVVIGPSADPFCRYDVQLGVSESGMESDAKWIPVR